MKSNAGEMTSMSSPKSSSTQDAFSATPVGVSDEDKAAFVKAMWDGLPSKDGSAQQKTKQTVSEDEPQKAVVLRKISAPEAVENTPLSEQALAVARAIEQGLSDSDLSQLQPHAMQALVSALCRLYGAQVEAQQDEAILGQGSLVTATDVMVVCGALLKSVDLQVFELGMWQAWSGR
jgi:hypothetical protein